MMRTSTNSGLISQPARFAGFLGIGFLVLFIAAIFAQGETPVSTDSADDIRAFFVDNRDQYLLSDFLIGIALVFLFLPFAACLRTILARAEGEPAILSRLFFTGAIITLAIGAAGGTGWGTLAMGAGDEALDDSSIKLMMYAGDYAFSAIGMGFALTALGASLVMISTGVVAKWVGYIGLVSVVLNVIGSAWIIDGDPEGAIAIFGWIGMLVVAVWILCTCVMLLRQGSASAVTAEPVAA